jgi:hypothetical protein
MKREDILDQYGPPETMDYDVVVVAVGPLAWPRRST